MKGMKIYPISSKRDSTLMVLLNLLDVNDIRKKILEQNHSMSQEQADNYSRAIFVRMADKSKKPELKKFFEKHPELKGKVGSDGEILGFETNLIMPLESEEILVSEADGSGKRLEILAKGTAIYPTLSLNFNRYLKSEIAKAESTLEGRSIQEDHNRSARGTIGTIDSTNYAESTGRLKYEGRLKRDHPVSENVRLKYIKNSSIGIRAERAECSICGENMGWFHEHIPGMEYEKKDGKMQLAELIPRNFVFTHLGITPFPGVSGASVSTETLESGEFPPIYEAPNHSFIETFSEMFAPYYNEVVESMQNANTIGSENVMTDEMEKLRADVEKQKALVEEYRTELKTVSEERKELSGFLEDQKKKDRESVVAEIIKSEIALNRLEESGAKLRMLDLSEKTDEQLQVRLEVLRDSVKALPSESQKKPKSKSFSGTTISETGLDETGSQNPIDGRAYREGQIERLGQIVYGEGYNPTFKTVRILDEWNNKRGRWKNPLKELI